MIHYFKKITDFYLKLFHCGSHIQIAGYTVRISKETVGFYKKYPQVTREGIGKQCL